MSDAITEEHAPAKLTWSLRVLGSRPDGYHALEALVTSVNEPGDAVFLEPAPRISLEVTGPAKKGVPEAEGNLAWKAAEACEARVAITLVKSIPAGAGLGGGSADAAAVLRGLRAHFGVAPAHVAAVAGALGSDVPVCLHGALAWMRGRGDVVEPVPAVEPVRVVVAIPRFPSSTPVVFRAWDELGGPRCARSIAPPPSLLHLVGELANDLEPAAEHVEPRLRPFRDAFERAAGRPALLAGSGSAYAAWFEDAAEWRAAAYRVERELGVRVFAGIAS